MHMTLMPEKLKEASMWRQETQQKQKKLDWTHFLTPEAVSLLREVLTRAYRHRTAYFEAHDIKAAQLWSAMLEMQRQINELNEKIDKLTPVQKETHRIDVPDDSPLMKKLQQLTMPNARDEKESTDALIDSLMKF